METSIGLLIFSLALLVSINIQGFSNRKTQKRIDRQEDRIDKLERDLHHAYSLLDELQEGN